MLKRFLTLFVIVVVSVALDIKKVHPLLLETAALTNTIFFILQKMDERIAHFERTEDRVRIGDSFPKKNGTTLPKSAKYKLGSVSENCFRFLRTSRFGGIPLALLYGFFTWYYLAFFLLSEPAALPDVKNNSALSSVFQ